MGNSWNAIGWLIFALLLSAITVVGWISGGLLAIWAWMGMNTLMVEAHVPNWIIAIMPIALVLFLVSFAVVHSQSDY